MNHPQLPAGYDSWDHNGDDINGSGVNEPVWPYLLDSFEAFTVLFITEEMLNFFETACPDYVVPSVADTILFPHQPNVYLVNEEGVGNINITAVDNVLRLPRGVRQQTIRRRA